MNTASSGGTIKITNMHKMRASRGEKGVERTLREVMAENSFDKKPTYTCRAPWLQSHFSCIIESCQKLKIKNLGRTSNSRHTRHPQSLTADFPSQKTWRARGSGATQTDYWEEGVSFKILYPKKRVSFENQENKLSQVNKNRKDLLASSTKNSIKSSGIK